MPYARWPKLLCLIGVAHLAALSQSALALSSPEGIWNCVIFGGRADERLSLILLPEAATHLVSQASSQSRVWRRVGDWERRRGEVSFADARAGRVYRADLDFDTLGGTWSGPGGVGGWWCARRPEAVESVVLDSIAAATEFYVPPLVPDSMSSPRYPRSAVRQAIEGDAVVCFVVDPSGQIRDPEIVSLSDEIFSGTVLSAIERSRYRPSSNPALVRPGCRSYEFTLDLIDE